VMTTYECKISYKFCMVVIEKSNIPISAFASGALGALKRLRRMRLPQVANPYLESFKIETP